MSKHAAAAYTRGWNDAMEQVMARYSEALDESGICVDGNSDTADLELPDVDLGRVDMVNHPPHYKQPWGEVIDVTRHFNFNMGNALKYIMRADHKGNPAQDLRKAIWYITDELKRRGHDD